jgi:phosphate:Na+ symporter
MLIALPLTVPVLRLVDRLMPDQAASPALNRVSALDPAALKVPDRALACVMRELLQMGEAVESMLRPVVGLYADWDDEAAEAIRKKEREVDKIHINTKLYLAKLQRDHSGDEVASRALELADMAVNLESAGNVISDTMLSLAQRLNQGGVAFSDKGLEEIRDFHDRVLSNAQGALNLLVTSSPDAARALVEEKDTVRDVEQGLQRAHLARLQQGLSESIETSNLHQETLRALKQVNSAFTMLAYPILSETGDLLASRLSRPKP